ncbi:MAG: zinc ribbon domain-containing protein [Thaumarchaeota archaeon]|nr:zinc ribbon domain-containing protein [Nitrososphaerota archaeon]
MFCPKCGKELVPDAAFCHNCGESVGAPSNMAGQGWNWERRWRPDRGTTDGWWGAVSAFGFLIIIGLTISQYPNAFTLMNRYFIGWGTVGYPFLPGYALGQVVIYFFTLCGIWGLVSAGLRFAFTNSISRPMRSVVGALFAFYIASVFSQYYAGTIAGSALVLTFFVGLGVVIVANALIAYYVPRRLPKQAFEH